MATTTTTDTSSNSPWFVIPQDDRAGVRLFCFPYAGGGALTYRSWIADLQPEIAVCPAHLPGREKRLLEAAFTSYRPLVEAVAANILPHLDKPFAFFGHSMGAIIGFELARYLQKHHGIKPVHLFVSGRRAPQIANSDPATYDLPAPEFIEEIQRLNGTPKEVLEHPELMQLLLPLLRADFQVCQTYDYIDEPRLACPITALGGLQDEDVGREVIEPWGEQTSGRFTMRMLPGDHFFVQTARAEILRILSNELR